MSEPKSYDEIMAEAGIPPSTPEDRFGFDGPNLVPGLREEFGAAYVRRAHEERCKMRRMGRERRRIYRAGQERHWRLVIAEWDRQDRAAGVKW